MTKRTFRIGERVKYANKEFREYGSIGIIELSEPDENYYKMRLSWDDTYRLFPLAQYQLWIGGSSDDFDYLPSIGTDSMMFLEAD